MGKPVVFVTRRWPSAVEDKLSELFEPVFNTEDTPPDRSTLRHAMTNCDAILPTVTDQLGKDLFDGLNPKIKIIANYGVGFSHIDTASAKAMGIAVSNTPDVLSECTADIALTLMLMVARRAAEGERELRGGNWSGWRPTHLMGSKLTGKTLGIIGFGRIGQATAHRAHFGFNMPIIAYGRSQISKSILDKYNASQTASIEDLLKKSDIVSLHCPGGEANRHMINSERLNQMKPTSILINTARGEVVDEAALALALKEGQIGGAGLDVFDGEPVINPALLDANNAVLLPHLGSATRETREAMGFRVVDNLVDHFEGKPPRDKVA